MCSLPNPLPTLLCIPNFIECDDFFGITAMIDSYQISCVHIRKKICIFSLQQLEALFSL